MKSKLFMLVAGLVAMYATPFGVVAQNEVLDAEQVARAVLRNDEATWFRGYFGFVRVLTDTQQNVYGHFEMRKQVSGEFRITKFSVGETNVALAAPRATLPLNEVGLTTDFHISVTGYMSEKSDPIVHGSFGTNLLVRGAPITIKLRPEFVRYFVDDPLPAGLSPENARIKIGEFDGVYDSWNRRFVIWLDPLFDPIGKEYQIIDISNGRVLRVAPITSVDETPVPVDSPVNFAYEGGVLEVLFGNDYWAEYRNQRLTTNVVVLRNGQYVPARVYMVRLEGTTFGIESWGLEAGSVIEVREVVEYGDMPIIISSVVTAEPESGKQGSNPPWIYVPAGHRAVVVTILGKTTSSQGFNAYFYRNIGVPTPVGVGGVGSE